jgi:predicted alpha/beta hydrolase
MLEEGSTGGGSIAAVTLIADDGFPLAATRFKAVGARLGTALIAPATGVAQRYYAAFAGHLAAAGWDVLTWDWRGVADSRHGLSWRDPRFTMHAWGALDLAAAIAWAERRSGDLPVVLVGHSFGGQAPGLAANAGRLDALILVAAQHGWLGHWPWPLRPVLWCFWTFVVPALTSLFGRLPSSRIGLGRDLPYHVAREWAAWCRRREGLGAWSGHAAMLSPILAVSGADDWIAPRGAVEALLREYAGSVAVRRRHLVPREVGRGRIGHFGFFQAGVVPGLWDEITAFLQERAAAEPTPVPRAG